VAKIDDTARLSAFVRRLRRIEAHPLIADDGGELMRTLRSTQFKAVVYPQTGEVVMKFELPDEVQFESLAARLRPMTLTNDTLGHAKVMDALDALTVESDDPRVAQANAKVRQAWCDATERDRTRGARTRAYSVLTGKAGDDAVDRATDLDLAYAWLYEDSVHGDLPSYDEFSARERYSAATHVFGGIACVALDTLEYLRFLIERGELVLPAEAFETPVVVTETKWEQRGMAYFGGPEQVADLADVGLDTPPPGMRPIHEMFERAEGDHV
jgi:hypothetical protein